MNKNFDCTQMLSFDRNVVSDDLLESIADFHAQGFNVLYDEDVCSFKKKYFNISGDSFVVELRDDNFSSEFDNWEILETPPKKISDFSKKITDIMKNGRVKNVNVYIVFFADPGISKTINICCDIEDIFRGLFNMSSHYYDVFGENMVLCVGNKSD